MDLYKSWVIVEELHTQKEKACRLLILLNFAGFNVYSTATVEGINANYSRIRYNDESKRIFITSVVQHGYDVRYGTKAQEVSYDEVMKEVLKVLGKEHEI